MNAYRVNGMPVYQSYDGRLWVVLEGAEETDESIAVCRYVESLSAQRLGHTALWSRQHLVLAESVFNS